MINIILVDNNPVRRADLNEALSDIGQEYQVVAFESVQDEIKTKLLKKNSVILLHVGKGQNEDVMEALNERYRDNRAICYSGGVEIKKQYIEHQGRNNNHCWFDQIVESRISDSIKKSLREYFKSLSSGDEERLCSKLNAIDMMLEHKLEILSLIAMRKPLQDIWDTGDFNELFKKRLVSRNDIEEAFSDYSKLRSLRSRWFPE